MKFKLTEYKYDRPQLSQEQKQFFDSRFKYYFYPLYHNGTVVDKFNDGAIWFCNNDEHAHGSNSGYTNAYIVGYNNPYEFECWNFDFDEIPLDTEQLKFMDMYKPEYGNKYDNCVPYDDEYYDEDHQYGNNDNYDLITVTSDQIVDKIFEKGYDCAILKNINELQFHIWTDNKDYVVKKNNQIKRLDNTNPTDSELVTEDTVKTSDGKWTNKGKDGTHGKFKTKKAADAQRKAMFASGWKG